MQSFQFRTLEYLAAAIARLGFEASTSTDWANTGTVNIHHKGAIVAIAQVRYDFQQQRYSLGLSIGGTDVSGMVSSANSECSPFWAILARELTTVPKVKGHGLGPNYTESGERV